MRRFVFSIWKIKVCFLKPHFALTRFPRNGGQAFGFLQDDCLKRLDGPSFTGPSPCPRITGRTQTHDRTGDNLDPLLAACGLDAHWNGRLGLINPCEDVVGRRPALRGFTASLASTARKRASPPIPDHAKTRYFPAALLQEAKCRKRAASNNNQSHWKVKDSLV